MAVKQWSLDCLWSWLGAAILVVSLLPAGLYVTHMFSVFAERNLVGRAEALAATLARQIIEILLVQDAIALHESLEKAIAADEQIRYAAVEDNHGNIVVHTFAEGFPAALRALWATPERVVRYSAGDDRLIDVSSPILGGQLGKLHVGISRAQAYAASNRALLLVGTAFLGGILIIVVGIQVISTSVSRPLGRLEMLVSRYPAAASGDAGTPWWNNGGLEVGGTREVQSLAKQFRHMVQKLDSLEQERLATQKSLICAERLATLGELASGLAHEIRNPLDGVQECIRCLQADPEKSEQAARYYPMMQQGLQRISRTIQEMLIFARSGQSVSPKRCHMSVVFDQLKLLVIPHMERREIDIRWHTEQNLICFCDPDALAQIGLNLMLNAIDAMNGQSSPRVEVWTWCDSRWLYLSIEDNGPGVPPDMRDQIFDAFFSTKPPGKGTGLGLTVSRQLIRAMGGELSLSDEPSSLGGARFVITVPKCVDEGTCHGADKDQHSHC